jgi:Ca2+-binding EF-hand superfamily protein
MTDFEKEEFWKSLGRLYDATNNLVIATEHLREIAESHEKRLDKLEVVQQWLAEKERKREKEGDAL